MAGIAEPLEGVDVVADAAGRHHIVHHRESAARFEHAMHLVEKIRNRVEVMRRDAAGDEVEAGVLERQRLGLGVSRAHIGEAALLRFAFHHVEHFLGDVGRPDPLDMRRESVGDVAAAGGDIERAPVFLRRGEVDQPLQALAERVRLEVR